MIKIFITGSNGFIGQELLSQAVSAEDLEPIALSRGEDRFPKEGGYEFESVDITDAGEVERLVRKHRPRCLIHTVAWANVEQCESDPQTCYSINTKPLEQLAFISEKYDVHLIYLSTDFIFDGLNGPYGETDTPNPLNVYGKSKLEAENLIRKSACRWSIIRTILVYGLPHDPGRSNLVLWVKESLEAKKRIQVVTNHFRMPTLVNDLAEMCLAIARREITGLFHISGEELYSVNEIARKVAQVWGLDESLIKDVHSNDLPSAVVRPDYTGFDITKAKNILGFRPHSLMEGLRRISDSITKAK
jgi:dTDP-4-dehydrorhamnose reductase